MAEPTNLYDWIFLQNIDDEDFRFYTDGTPYEIEAGQARAFPRFMARIALKHLITKILHKRDPEGKLAKNVREREILAAQIVLEERPMAMPVKRSQDEINQELVSKMNTASDLENVLKRRKDSLRSVNPSQDTDDHGNPIAQPKKPLIPPPAVIPPSVAPGSVTDGAEDAPPPKTAKTEAKIKSTKTKAVETNEDGPTKLPAEIKDNDSGEGTKFKVPTREVLMAYAKNDLKMDMTDKKTLAAFEKMTDEDLAIELAYPMDEE